MDTLNFKPTFLGQCIIKYQVPLDIFTSINQIYEQNYNNLAPANGQLVGKIEKEHSLFYHGEDQTKMKNHNFLPNNVTDYFMQVFNHYLKFNAIRDYNTHLNSIWVNEMKAHEYNPIHIHQGKLFTGLSSVMIMKLPTDTGIEYSAPEKPMNGRLQIIGASAGQFAKTDYSPNSKIGDFYVFPYDMRHCVYPFNGPGYRRTLAANMDVQYDPIRNRGVS